jgi:hypothetical protein
MPVIDGPLNTYSDTTPQRRTITDVISLIDPYDTPFITATGGLDGASGKFRFVNTPGKLVEWLEDNLLAMTDPPREEVKNVMGTCTQAGIKTVMITGDHKLTAVAIAKEIGMYNEGDMVLTGPELEKISDEELVKIVDKVSVYARIPARWVKSWRAPW